MDGTWLFRKDKSDKGKTHGWASETGEANWTQVQVPNAWNAGDDSSASMAGSVVWYRKDFKLPDNDKALAWKVLFESVRYRADVYLNGRLLNSHDGGYVPFEVKLDGLKPGKVNRLVVRVDNRRQPTDLPPSRVTITGAPSGGWWNYGGLLGDVYLRRINRLDFGTVGVRPILDSRAGPAHIQYTVPIANYGKKALRVNVTSNFGFATIDLGKQKIEPGAGEDVHRHARRADAAPVVAGRPVPLPGQDRGEEERPHVRGLRPVERDQIDQGRQRPAAAQRRAGQPARRLRAPGRAERRRRGHPGDGAGDDRPAQGRRRDAAAHALPVQPADARDGRPGRRLPVVGDPRLPGADRRPQEEGRHGRGGVAAQGEHHRVREPPVGPRRGRSATSWRPSRRASSASGSTAARGSSRRSTRRGRCRWRSRATRDRAASPPTRRSSCSGSTTTSAGIRGRAARSPTRTSCRASSTACAAATRRRRS